MLDDLSGALILVTGANGFVGGRVSRRLVDEGTEVRALVRRAGDAAILEGPGIDEWVGAFTETEDARRAIEGVDAVVHCAATAGDDLAEVRRVNRDGSRTIASAALDEGVAAFVHISTGSVYDRGDTDEVTEDTPRVSDGTPYAVTKAEAEQEVESASDRGLAAVILRPPAVRAGVRPRRGDNGSREHWRRTRCRSCVVGRRRWRGYTWTISPVRSPTS